jgi:hypothetical protein
MAPLWIPAATFRFAPAKNGMTITAAVAMTIPGRLRWGVLWPISVEA